MKRIWELIRALAPHICIICTGMIMTFLVIDSLNAYIGFINHRYTRIVLWIWAGSALLSAILLIAAQRREARRVQPRARHEAPDSRKKGDS